MLVRVCWWSHSRLEIFDKTQDDEDNLEVCVQEEVRRNVLRSALFLLPLDANYNTMNAMSTIACRRYAVRGARIDIDIALE